MLEIRSATPADVNRVIGLAVQEHHRCQGIARAMVERLAEMSAEMGCRALSLSTVTATGNAPIFKALGFDVVDVAPAEFCLGLTGETLQEALVERPSPVVTRSSDR